MFSKKKNKQKKEKEKEKECIKRKNLIGLLKKISKVITIKTHIQNVKDNMNFTLQIQNQQSSGLNCCHLWREEDFVPSNTYAKWN